MANTIPIHPAVDGGVKPSVPDLRVEHLFANVPKTRLKLVLKGIVCATMPAAARSAGSLQRLSSQ